MSIEKKGWAYNVQKINIMGWQAGINVFSSTHNFKHQNPKTVNINFFCELTTSCIFRC